MKYSVVLLVLVLTTHRPALAQQALQDAYGLTAYRPQHGTGYHPFARTAVPEAFEEHRFLGPGIRVNHADERDLEVEDDLIELVVTRPSADAAFALERSDTSLSVWKTRRKLPQTEVAFTNNRSTPLAFGEAHLITLWVEWTGAAPAFPTLSLLPLESGVVDRIVFHAFTGLVVALGGENQEPDYPVDIGHGTYRVATTLYERGWDVLMRDEDEVESDGTGLVYDEVVNAIQNRDVRELAVFGYSHGGGSTYDLCERLVDTTSLSPFSVGFTAYIDGIENGGSDLMDTVLKTLFGVDSDTDPEMRRPPASDFHLNIYQKASEADGQRVLAEGLDRVDALGAETLDGGPMAGSIPPLDGLDLNIEESVNWDMTAHHFDIDDLDRVHDFIRAELTARLSR